MSEERIKVKELGTELSRDPKDVLRAAQDFGMSVKTLQGSVSLEEAGRLRDHFASVKRAEEARTSKPSVIVRRRRRDSQPSPSPAAASAPKGKPAADAVMPKAKAAADTGAPKTQTSPAPSRPARAESPTAAPKNRPVKRVIETPARVIRRPDDPMPTPPAPAPAAQAPQAASPASPAEAPAAVGRPTPAAPKPPKAPAEPRVSGVLTAILAGQKASAKEERKPAASTGEQAATTAPATDNAPATSPLPPTPQAPVLEEKPNKPPRQNAVSASSVPEETAQPAQGAHTPESKKTPDVEKGAEKGKERPAPTRASASPQVRVISRPTAAAAPDRRSSRTDNRPSSPRDTSGRPARSGGGRPSAGRSYAGSRNQAAATYGQQPSSMPGDGREGQSKKKRNKGRRTVDFQQGDFGRHGSDDDDNVRMNRTNKVRRKPNKAAPAPQVTQPIKAAKRKIRITEAIRVADMAHQMGLKANEIIKVLLNLGVMATINQSLDIDTATLVAAEFHYEVEKTGFSEEDYLTPKEADSPESLKPRPPVVTIMGHVDHGKTSLLDAIRKSNVTSGEAGGITQHIGAYHVKTRRGEIVFLDTPGHEAFTAMRARGAQITDLVILVVAADDGVMEQTREAINHSRAANVPIMVAVNKMDKPGADPDRVLRELAELGLQAEDWGGDTIVAKVSAKTRMGLDDLLEMVALQSEIMELKANPDKPARGHIIEAKLDKGRGPVATVLIQEGTLRQGDNFVCGSFSGRARALLNDQGKKVKDAGPSLPVEVQGFEGVPEAGEEFFVVEDEKVARRIADARAARQRERALAAESRVTLETWSQHLAEQETLTLNLLIKADVQGSLEAITEALNKQSTEKVRISVVHGGTGAISESDILLASASQAIIIGFNVRPTAKIKEVAEHENVDIRFYDIIYKLVDDIKNAMAGMLAPVQREVYLGQAEVRQTFNVPKVGLIAGSYVADGKIARNAGVRLLREGVVVYTGKISSLRRFKDDVKEIIKGNECGVGLDNFNDIKIGDIIEAFETVEEAATL